MKKEAGKKSGAVLIIGLIALIVLLIYHRLTQAERVDSEMAQVNIHMILAPLFVLILICSTYWFKYYCSKNKKNEIVSKFNAWKRGDTCGAKLWRGFNILSLICLIIYTLLRLFNLF